MKRMICSLVIGLIALSGAHAYNPTIDDQAMLSRIILLAEDKTSDEINKIVGVLEELLEDGLDDHKEYLARYILEYLAPENDYEEESEVEEQDMVVDYEETDNYVPGKRTCSEFSTCEEAIQALEAGANELDKDGDGEPCETDLC